MESRFNNGTRLNVSGGTHNRSEMHRLVTRSKRAFSEGWKGLLLQVGRLHLTRLGKWAVEGMERVLCSRNLSLISEIEISL